MYLICSEFAKKSDFYNVLFFLFATFPRWRNICDKGDNWFLYLKKNSHREWEKMRNIINV
jgi:hypothetical protein